MNLIETLENILGTTTNQRVDEIVEEVSETEEQSSHVQDNQAIPLYPINKPDENGTAGMLWEYAFGDSGPDSLKEWAERLYVNRGHIPPETVTSLQTEDNLELPVPIRNVIEKTEEGGIVSPPIIDVFKAQREMHSVIHPVVSFEE